MGIFSTYGRGGFRIFKEHVMGLCEELKSALIELFDEHLIDRRKYVEF